MTSAGRARLAALAPDTAAALTEVERLAATTVDAATLELVRRQVAACLDLPAPTGGALTTDQVTGLADWRAAPCFDARERALLAFVEQFVFSVSSVGDDLVDALLEHHSPVQVHEICNVVWAVDLTTRADHVAAAVLG